MKEDAERNIDFIRTIIQEDKARLGENFRLHTRFPPEPNGYLHLGHAKAICLNFALAAEFGGKCNLRFDDTNPEKEKTDYVKAIIADIDWLGFDPAKICYASDYFEQFYLWAVELIETGKAYIDEQSPDQIREQRGTPTSKGTDSPFRNRAPQESLALFQQMKDGAFEDGAMVLRARIDMQHANINMRDPVLYRIRKVEHHRQGNTWNIYPLYDFAHGYEDAIEGITHSICTLEFENHRPLYDWLLANVSIPHVPQQIEFAKLNLTYTMMSKRNLLQLVERNIVDGWNDPRMPTISGVKRRGYTPTAIKQFCQDIGLTKVESLVDLEFLNFVLREELNPTASRIMAISDPIKLIITNYDEAKSEIFTAENHPDNPAQGTREIPFSRELYIDRSDFMLEPPKGYFRLTIGKEVRLKYAYYITADEVIFDDDNNIIAVHCHYDPESRGGGTPDGRKVKGTIQWVDAKQGLDCQINDYNHLFTLEDMRQIPDGKDYSDYLNPDSLIQWNGAKIEPNITSLLDKERFQFMRMGYYFHDTDAAAQSSAKNKLVFNRIVSLKDSWNKKKK